MSTRIAHIFVLTGAVIALLGAFLPLSRTLFLVMTVPKLSGIAYGLFVFPMELMSLVLDALYGSIAAPRRWYLLVGILGIVLAIFCVVASAELTANRAQLFSRQLIPLSVSLRATAISGYLLVLGYLTVIVSALWARPSSPTAPS